MQPSRALVPISPEAPHAPAAPTGSPLGRSGLDLEDLFGTPDQVVARQRTPAVAMEVGLEQARGALLRNLAGDALAALDGVWDGARRTEEGWYLRSGALTLLGLPGESDRVADEGLGTSPSSVALRFVQSLARLAVGDVAGARAVLQPAIERAPQEPLLLVQQAIVQARQGDTEGAERLLQRVMRSSPDHPALEYGRAWVRASAADVSRNLSRSAWGIAGEVVQPEQAMLDAAPLLERREVEDAPTVARSTPPQGAQDVIDGAFTRIGARLITDSNLDATRDCRMLVRAFSAGGSLAAACTPEQAHAARALLMVFVSVLTNEPADRPQPFRTVLQQLVAALRDARVSDADRLVKKATSLTREPTVRLLQTVVRGAFDELQRSGRTVTRGVLHTPPGGGSVVRGEADPGTVVPLRLGLGLLSETPSSRATSRSLEPDRWPVLVPQPGDRFGAVAPSAEVTGSYRVLDENDPALQAWGAAQAVAMGQRAGEQHLANGAASRSLALLCVGIAIAALSTGHVAAAVGLGFGASWLALRRNGRSAQRAAHAHAESEQRGRTGRATDPRGVDHVSDGRR